MEVRGLAKRFWPVALSVIAGGTWWWGSHDPQECLDEFMYGDKHGYFEIELCDPLILCRGDIDSLVLEEVEDPCMPLRGYALLYLADYVGSPALPTFRRIIGDSGESPGDRACSLRGLALLEPDEAVRLADPYFHRSDELGHKARGIVMSAKQAREDLAVASTPRAAHGEGPRAGAKPPVRRSRREAIGAVVRRFFNEPR